jgi:AcrR family transcriptional regulator
MTRPYTLRRRAEQQAETRLKIVEAAVACHSTLGPARTPMSMIAERAGVQRHTLYAHFPDERSLAMACSGHFFEQSPPPDAADWRGLAVGRARLIAGLSAIYRWYAENAQAIAVVLRDAEHHALTREVMELRLGPAAAAWHEVLGAGLSESQRTMLHLMLSFHSWRTMVEESAVDRVTAVRLASRAIVGAGAKEATPT